MTKRVIYHRLFSFGKYENERIGFEEEIDDDQNADQVLGQLYLKVCDIEGVLQAYRDTLENVKYLKEQVESDFHNVSRIKNEISDMKVRIAEISELLKKGDVEVDEKLRHACDRRTLKTLQENLRHAQQRLLEHKKQLAAATSQRDILKDRVKTGNFSLEGIKIGRRPAYDHY